jgi:hypothetical protein
MRVALLVLLALVLLAVLGWHERDRAAPSGLPAGLVGETTAPPARAHTEIEAPPFGVAESIARQAIETPALVPAPRAPEAPKITVRGRLLDPAGRGVAGTVHVCERARDAGSVWGAPRRTRAAADGAFAVELHTGKRGALIGCAAGYAPSEVCFLDASDARADVTLLMRSYTEIRGVVVDEHGAPRQGKLVIATPLVTDAEGSRLPWVPELMADEHRTEQRGASWHTECAADGSFAFSFVIPRDRVTLTYSPDDLAFVQWRDVRPGDQELRLVVRSDDVRCGSVSGAVRGPDGAPLTEYEIQVDGWKWHRADDPRGHFEVRAQWGSEAPILVRARVPDGGISATRPLNGPFPSVAMTGDGPVHWVGTCRIDRDAQELVLQVAPPGRLTVRVRDRDGEPVAQAAIRLEMDARATRGTRVWQPFSGWPLLGETDAHGEARFAGLGAGPYRAHVVANGRSIETLTAVRSGAEQSLVVEAR